MSRDDTSMAALQEKWDEHKDRIRKGLDFLAPFLKDDKVNITSIREAFESLRSENAQLRAECGELREALTRCVEELEESVELEGRLSSFVAAAKKARAALSRQKAVQNPDDCHNECKLPFDAHCHATDSGWLCTRKLDHDGLHIACGGGQGHAFHSWNVPPKDTALNPETTLSDVLKEALESDDALAGRIHRPERD